MATFIPRTTFSISTTSSIPRAYFLGHHRAGLAKMKRLTSQIDLVVECRDARIPITCRNELLDEAVGQIARIVVYTKSDLAFPSRAAAATQQSTISQWDAPSDVLFYSKYDQSCTRRLLGLLRRHASSSSSLLGLRALVVGMPNVGKSTLLNGLRSASMHKGKAARTGAQPGVTRKVSTAVKIIDEENGNNSAYLFDTPGVFLPHVPDAESMLKLALCGSVKDTIVPATMLVDYLLFHINVRGHSDVYSSYTAPTNDVAVLLDTVARRTGKLRRGAAPDVHAAALWFLHRWRAGKFAPAASFMLDDIENGINTIPRSGSLNQAIKAERMIRRPRFMRKRAG